MDSSKIQPFRSLLFTSPLVLTPSLVHYPLPQTVSPRRFSKPVSAPALHRPRSSFRASSSEPNERPPANDAAPLNLLRRLVQLRRNFRSDSTGTAGTSSNPFTAFADAVSKLTSANASSPAGSDNSSSPTSGLSLSPSLLSLFFQTDVDTEQQETLLDESNDDAEGETIPSSAPAGNVVGKTAEEQYYCVPTSPPLDPITAIILAGYAFRAYSNPKPSVYRHSYTSVVPPSSTSKRQPQPNDVQKVINTDIYYTDEPMISSSSNGVFLISFKLSVDTKDMSLKDFAPSSLPSVTASVNGAITSLLEDEKSKASMLASASLLRLRLPSDSIYQSNLELSEGDESIDVLHVALKGREIVMEARVSLEQVVRDALRSKEARSIEVQQLQFSKQPKSTVEYFGSSGILPNDFDILSMFSSSIQPFSQMNTTDTRDDESMFNALRVKLSVTFVPFPDRKQTYRPRAKEKKPENSEPSEPDVAEVFRLAQQSLGTLKLEKVTNVVQIEESDGPNEQSDTNLSEPAVLNGNPGERSSEDFDQNLCLDEQSNSSPNAAIPEEASANESSAEPDDVSTMYDQLDSTEKRSEWRLSELQLPIQLPDIQLPEISLPQPPSLPEIQIPEVQIPFGSVPTRLDVQLPELRLTQSVISSLSQVLTDASDLSSFKGATAWIAQLLESQPSPSTANEPERLPEASEWARLSGACRTIVKSLSDSLQLSRTSRVSEDGNLELFIDSKATDTQIGLFLDRENDCVIISFRGTEQMSWRDFLTDAQLFLQRWEPGDEQIVLDISPDRTVGLSSFLPDAIFKKMKAQISQSIPPDASAVHFGFLQAYMSVRMALRHALEDVLCCVEDAKNSDVQLLFTGHSLGGALATIAASDLQAHYGFPEGKVVCMTYGSPKVGNANFARLFNQLVPNAFRIINDKDVIARLPYSLGADKDEFKYLAKYRHSGRTVIINDDGEIWAEGITEILDDDEWSWRDGKDVLQELLKFENTPLSKLVDPRAVKQHMEDSYFYAFRVSLEKFAHRHSNKIGNNLK